MLDERAVGDGAAGDEDGGTQGEEAEREDGAVCRRSSLQIVGLWLRELEEGAAQ